MWLSHANDGLAKLIDGLELIQTAGPGRRNAMGLFQSHDVFDFVNAHHTPWSTMLFFWHHLLDGPFHFLYLFLVHLGKAPHACRDRIYRKRRRQGNETGQQAHREKR